MGTSPRRKKKKLRFHWITAVVVLILIFTFFQTTAGAKAMENAKKAATNFIDSLFPPKDISVSIEGETEVKHHEAAGQEPETQEDGTVTAPGFIIYYDTELYTKIEENGITYIRFVADNELPPCEVEIQHIPGAVPSEAAETARKTMAESWSTVSEVSPLETGEGFIFSFSAGMNWDSPCGNVYFLSDGCDGCFQITSRYFLEASEGHGARFRQMIQTFQVIDP